jgi:hypothetical protein
MRVFAVAVRRVGHEYLVCVEGIANAKWLLEQLARSFVFRSARAISEEPGSAVCSFHVPYNSRLSAVHFNKLLTSIPEVLLLSK